MRQHWLQEITAGHLRLGLLFDKVRFGAIDSHGMANEDPAPRAGSARIWPGQRGCRQGVDEPRRQGVAGQDCAGCGFNENQVCRNEKREAKTLVDARLHQLYDDMLPNVPYLVQPIPKKNEKKEDKDKPPKLSYKRKLKRDDIKLVT